MDDFVELPKKKLKAKKKMDAADRRHNKDILFVDITCKGSQTLILTEVYGYEDIEPMFRDDDEDALAFNVDLSNEDDAMFVGRTFATRGF